jgi:carbon storage regulator
MLVLSRKTDERIIIDERITITILEVRGNQIRIGIEAPKEMPVLREELSLRKAVTVTAA